MRAQNLAISIPKTTECDKKCPYCISLMTGYLEPNFDLFYKNLKKAKTLAKHANITSVLITGKGEPMQDVANVCYVLEKFEEFPTELQTNGKFLYKYPEYLDMLAERGLNVLAISIDNYDEIFKYKHLVEHAQAVGMLVRYTVNMTDRFSECTFNEIFRDCKKSGIDQFSLRDVTIPTDALNTEESNKAQKWIREHVNQSENTRIHSEMIEAIRESGRYLMKLPYDATLYDLEGISVTWFDYCVQDSNEGDDIRSLIYQEDGHLQTCWNSKASRIF